MNGRPGRSRMPSRRRFLAGLAGIASTSLLSCQAPHRASPKVVEVEITARPARAQLVPAGHPATNVWAYNDSIPGPLLRLRQGDRLRALLRNGLPEGTTIHWHGVRLPNAMDGVPVITQPSVLPGSEFLYDFALPDAGTFFYRWAT